MNFTGKVMVLFLNGVFYWKRYATISIEWVLPAFQIMIFK